MAALRHKITLTAEAERDLQAIYNQRLALRGALGSDGADALLDHLFDVMSSLADFPFRGPIPPELVTIGMTDWRQISTPPYRIIYTATDARITIAVVADARQDFASLLERRLLLR